MFQWLTEVDKPIVNRNKDRHSDLKIETLKEKNNKNEISDIFLFVASPDTIFNINFLTMLRTPTSFSLSVILNEIAPHYEKVQMIKMNDIVTKINLKFLKSHSQKLLKEALFKETKDSIINDIYRTDKLYIPTHETKLKYFKVKCKYIQPVSHTDFERVMDFIDSSFLSSGESFSLRPSGWVLEDGLRNSIAIRTFSSFSKEIILVVDSIDNTVIAMDIYK
ncbi:hypothetical protein MUO14_12835 [Halobacillus shinanisalinarum]|uniref:Uncharacterized protein n=1 Tax=Halobacillus shinanisalinarum TaxID=2932258 RepID=A0ABY4GU51_9BACI|nr:hypothetical protein [Halobacillus shinanisalinarum]UOQ91471.1 hypothetical protein MUO14_12835 [Halobacillus shinanisalinarum]